MPDAIRERRRTRPWWGLATSSVRQRFRRSEALRGGLGRRWREGEGAQGMRHEDEPWRVPGAPMAVAQMASTLDARCSR